MKKINLKMKTKAKDKNKKTVKPKEKRVLWKSILSIILIVAIVIVSLILIFILYIVISSPEFEKDKLYNQEPTVLYDINGDEFARVGYEDSKLLSFDELPEVLIDAVVATEDSRFFQHNGLDLFRFLKASFGQLLGMKSSGGASTLSMQVVKNTYTKVNSTETTAESFIRKFKDIYIAVFKLEKSYTKEEIIEFYLNSQWFASTTNINVSSGIFGVERASEYYFGKSAKDINLAEASLLAGMFQNPIKYNLYTNPEGCKNRQILVLTYLVNHGYITEEQKEEVANIPISSLLIEQDDSTTSSTNEYQAFIDYVLDEVEDDLNLNAFDTPLKIYTTFDPSVQKTITAVENGDAYQFPTDKTQIGIAVTNTEDGSLVAISGGRDYIAKGTNRASDIKKQPGSTAKPIFDYAMYIENISQSTYGMVLDEPTTYSNGTSISNYDNSYKGLITIRYALSDSRNIPALRVFKAVASLDQSLIEDFVHSVGIDYGDYLYESAAIGGLEEGVSPIELSAAYGTFARGGYYIEPYSYTKVVNTENNKEYINSYSKEKVMEESTAYLLTNILLDAYGGKSPSGTTVAGKTGTTNLDKETRSKYGLPSGSLIDVWIVSYSPSYSISLWYGYDQIYQDAAENKYYLTSSTGGTGRRQIMNYLSTNIHKKNQTFKVPNSVIKVNVEKETFPAQLCSDYTPSSLCLSEYFVKGTEPTEISSRFSTLDNPDNGSYTFDGSTITLKWDPISTPDAIDTTSLKAHFAKYYEEYADKYYEARLSYNNANIGTLGYQIYLVNSSGTETYLGYTSSNTYTYSTSASGDYTFLIKSAYSIFKSNMSSGLKIVAKTDIDSNISNIVGDDDNQNDNNDNQDNDNNSD